MILPTADFGTTACKWDSVIPLEPMWKELKRITKPNSAIVLFGSQPFTSKLILSNFEMFKYNLIWKKNTCTGLIVSFPKLDFTEQDILDFISTWDGMNKSWGVFNSKDYPYSK